MCLDHDSEPPVVAGDRRVTTRDLTLTADDGNVLMASEAVGEESSDAAVVVLPDVRGLFQFYKDLATRLAQAGHDAVAIDYFGRTDRARGTPQRLGLHATCRRHHPRRDP